ncbi:MAG: hypothetical protein ACRCYC_06440 [Paraclostridium sp.]|uniref:hypothetical protein n=1 Tax=Paraclostridium sp. TaxID=2023273 RepID=UPI003F3CDDE9
MLEKLFKSKKKSALRIEKELLEIEIEKLRDEIRKKDGFLKCKNSLFIKKDNEKKQETNWQEIENQLKKYYKENNELREVIKESEKIISISYLKFNYLIQIEKYLYEAKFKELVEILKRKGNKFVQDLSESVIEHLSVEDSLKLELEIKFKKFQRLEINWEIKTQLLKGEKLSKIYSKHRKFKNTMVCENKEFISDLEKYDFDILVSKGFSLYEVEELKKICQDYISKYKVKNINNFIN